MARVLVIEDNPANQELMVYLLRAFGHDVSTASDGRQGLEMAERELPDLIICDIHLPVVDGYQVAQVAKRNVRLRPIPLVAVTALAMVGDREKILAAGFDGYITKPIAPERFVSDIEAALRLAPA
jgi:CheY-like chemotaxis protein